MQKQGKADSEAVFDAKINPATAKANLVLADLKMAVTTAKSAASANSLWIEFYGDLRLGITGKKLILIRK